MHQQKSNSILGVLRRRFSKLLATKLIILFGLQIYAPFQGFALTSGPSQPEAAQFTPIGTTDLVDPFTGDFSYSIPIMDVPGPNGGYPLSLGYNSGITMDQEASWVGLGWNLNAGAITRNMRGLPDEFNGDRIHVEQDMKESVTVSASGELSDIELFGFETGKNSGENCERGDGSLPEPSDLFTLDNATPDFGNAVGGANICASIGLTITYNNYEGLSYSIDPSMSVAKTDAPSKTYNLGTSFDSQTGFDISPGISMSSKIGGALGTTDLSINYGSRDGLSGQLGLGLYKTGEKRLVGSSSRSYVGMAQLPTFSREMLTQSSTATFKTGVGAGGVFGSVAFTYHSTEQGIHPDAKDTYMKAYGYNNLQNYNNERSNSVSDVNKDNVSLLTKHSSHLSPSSLTYDTYSVAGQGNNGSFRAHREVIGETFNPESESKTYAFGAGLDVSASGHRVGGNLSFQKTKLKTGKWSNKNEAGSKYAFEGSLEDGQEAYYYKLDQELAVEDPEFMDHIGGTNASRVELKKSTRGLLNRLNVFGADDLSSLSNSYNKKERTSRTSSITEIKNGHCRFGNVTHVPELKIGVIDGYKEDLLGTNSQSNYKDLNNYLFSLNRADHANHHNAAFISTNASGARYVYGLPVYNNKHIERQFSVDIDNDGIHKKEDYKLLENELEVRVPDDYRISGTNKFNYKRELPKYAHSHLLTSVLGTDYVDIDNVDGPSDGDAGYWTKFNYTKTSKNYKWRAPFSKATYIEGAAETVEDDLGNYQYGEKEVYYLTTVETKTHIAIFRISARADGFGPANETQNNNGKDVSNPLYKLDQIDLYTKEEFKNKSNPVPLKTAHFEYDYSLCENIPNNSDRTNLIGNEIENQGGKLTLKHVWFTYENSKRGELSKYNFHYPETQNGNPDYNLFLNDRWGCYKYNPNFSIVENQKRNASDSYVTQNFYDGTEGSDSQLLTKEQFDEQQAAWSMTKIDMPSGSTMEIDYEADEYTHVQDKSALRMFKIHSLMDSNDVPATQSDAESGATFNDNQKRVVFKLDHPIPNTEEAKEQAKKDYLRGVGNQVYFKLDMKVHKTESDFFSEVNGYSNREVEEDAIGFLDEDNDGNLDLGYITISSDVQNYHPFSLAGWQHLRVNAPKLLQTNKAFDVEKNASDAKKKSLAKSLVKSSGGILRMFRGYYDHCSKRSYSRNINLENSFIRLGTGYRITKYGGGVRVKSILINDNWNTQTNGAEESSIYGQYYEYKDGVASYEPLLGGDENPFRKQLSDKIRVPLRTNYEIAYESPINEELFPSPVVGYSEVVVKSRAANLKAESNQGLIDVKYKDIMSTGSVKHEFYTAKDFPVIFKEPNAETDYLVIPSLLFAGTSVFAGSQGYLTEVNDMHGKMKKTSSYEQFQDGTFDTDPYAYSHYFYKTNEDDIHKLSNAVEVQTIAENGLPIKVDKTLGVEYDVTLEMSEDVLTSTTTGAHVAAENTTGVPLGVPSDVPVIEGMPQLGYQENRNRVSVFNKLIHRSGIIDHVEVFDGQATTTTQNEVFDLLTGGAILTSVNNNFDDKIYSWNTPAYQKYDGMGAAYQNEGLKVQLEPTNVVSSSDQTKKYFSVSNKAMDLLKQGDELATAIGKLIFEKEEVVTFDWPGSDSRKIALFTGKSNYPTSLAINAVIMRSGRRNILGASAQNVTTLVDNPLDLGKVSLGPVCDFDYDLPNKTQNGTKCVNDYPIEHIESVYLFAFDKYSQLTVNQIHDLDEWHPYILNLDDNGMTNPNWVDAYGREINRIAMYKMPLYDNVDGEDCEGDKKVTSWSVSFESPRRRTTNGRGAGYGYVINYYNYTSTRSSAVKNGISYKKNRNTTDNSINELPQEEIFIKHDKLDENIFEGIVNVKLPVSCNQSRFGIMVITYQDSINQYPRFSEPYINSRGTTSYRMIGSYVEGLTSSSGSNGVNGRLYREKLEACRVDRSNDRLSGEYDPNLLFTYAGNSKFLVSEFTSRLFTDNDYHYISQNYWKDVPNYDYSISKEKESFEPLIVDKVLNVGTATYSDNYDHKNSAFKSTFENLFSPSAFVSGEKGVWRTDAGYVYINEEKDRLLNNETQIINTRTDGTIDDVILFDHKNPKFDECELKWRKVKEITEYNSLSYETENKDILGVYSSALYGYNGTLPIAVAGNAKENELAFEDFEYYNVSSSISAKNYDFTGNLDFQGLNRTSVSQVVEYIELEVESGNNLDRVFLLNKPLNEVANLLEIGDEVQLYGASIKDYTDKVANGMVTIEELSEVDGKTVVHFSNSRFDHHSVWFGKMVVEKLEEQTENEVEEDGFLVIDTKSHTGKNSLFVLEDQIFQQFNYKPDEGEKHVFSCWISLPDAIEESADSYAGNQNSLCDNESEFVFSNFQSLGRWSDHKNNTSWDISNGNVSKNVYTSTSNAEIRDPLYRDFAMNSEIEYSIQLDYKVNGTRPSTSALSIKGVNLSADGSRELSSSPAVQIENGKITKFSFDQDYSSIAVFIDQDENTMQSSHSGITWSIESIYLEPTSVVGNCIAFTGPEFKLSFLNESGNELVGYVAQPITNIIDGWQKFEVVTDELPSYEKISLTMINPETNNTKIPMYIDDIRLSPLRSGMQSYVYDPDTHRLVSTLDVNNYATYYYYNRAGDLHLTKRETERGVVTLTENRAHNAVNITPQN